MPNRKFKLIYLSHDLTKKVELNLSRRRVKAILLGLAFCFLLTNVVAGLFMSRLINSSENESLTSENERLRENLTHLQNKFEVVSERLSGLAETDQILRLMADLPVVDKETRGVGIGGDLGEPEFGTDDIDVSEANWTIDKLEREINLQLASFEEIRQKLTANEDLLAHTPSLRPVDGGYISSGFGLRRDPFTKRVTNHAGVDIPQERGTPVLAAADGQIIYAGRYFNYGNFVVIDHGFGYQTAYGHLQKYSVQIGQYVTKGQQIANVGSTGRSTSPHLHYEVRVNGQPVDPTDYFFDEVAAFPMAVPTTMATTEDHHEH